MNEYEIPIVLTIEAHSCINAIKIAELIIEQLEEKGEVAELGSKIDYVGSTI